MYVVKYVNILVVYSKYILSWELQIYSKSITNDHILYKGNYCFKYTIYIYSYITLSAYLKYNY